MGGLPGPRGPGKDATRAEQFAAALALLIFPATGFCIVLFAELWKQGLPLLLALAAGLSLAGFVVTRRLSERMSFALVTALQGAFWNFAAIAGAAFMGAVLSVATGFS